MKLNIAPKVTVCMGIFGVACGSGLSIYIANANDKLSQLSWMVVPLFVIGFASLFYAFYTVVASRRDPVAEQEQRKKALRQTMRDLKREYRKTHHVASQFLLGAEYYIQRTSFADASLIHEIIEEEGEKE